MASGAMGAGALHNIEPNKPVRMKVLIQCIEAKLQILAIPWMSPQFGKWQKNDGLGRVEAPLIRQCLKLSFAGRIPLTGGAWGPREPCGSSPGSGPRAYFTDMFTELELTPA